MTKLNVIPYSETPGVTHALCYSATVPQPCSSNCPTDVTTLLWQRLILISKFKIGKLLEIQ